MKSQKLFRCPVCDDFKSCGAGLKLNAFPGASPVALVVKNLPANAGDIEPRVQSLGQEDPLEEEMTTHSSILAWRIPWTEKPGGLQSMGSQRVIYS